MVVENSGSIPLKAALRGLWDIFSLFLKHSNCSVIERFPDGTVLEAVLHSDHKPPPPRALVALVKAKAIQQKAVFRKAALAVGLPANAFGRASNKASNAFEDAALSSSMTSGGSTAAKAIPSAKEDKKKAKKKVQKKKAKAKKRAAAKEANAGGGKEKETDDGDESSGTDDGIGSDDDEGECLPGEENLVDTTDVPDLTAMLEEARLANETKEADKK